jgi:hypothetical protein
MSTREDASLAKVNAEIDECMAMLETLRARYEQYFLGLERTPPDRERAEVFRRLHHLEHTVVNNTVTKFKLQTLSQKFRTYNEYWSRTLRQIEDGTYVRHVAKARKLAARLDGAPQAAAPQAAAPALASADAPAPPPKQTSRAFLDEIGDLADDFLASLDQTFGGAPKAAPTSTSPAPPASPAPPVVMQTLAPKPAPKPLASAAPAAPPPATPKPAAVPDEARALYDQLARARAQANGGKPAAAMPAFDDFRRSLDQQAQRLQQGNPSRKVRFRVVVQDGKPLIQPVVDP